MKFAIIDEQNIVLNVAVADAPVEPVESDEDTPVLSWIPLSEQASVQAGDIYDPETAQFSSPETAPEPAIRKITLFAFRSRFTLEEKVAIKTSTDPIIQVFKDDLTAAQFVDLDFQDTINGVNYLIQEQILAPERYADIMRDGSPASAA